MIELPMDIYEGRVGGEFRIKSHDYDSWYFPELFGMVRAIRRDGCAESVEVVAMANWLWEFVGEVRERQGLTGVCEHM